MRISVLNRKLRKAFGGRVTAALEDNCIVATAASKTFNLAGLVGSYHFSGE